MCGLSCFLLGGGRAQSVVVLPDITASVPAGAQPFEFVSDAPPGQGWGLGDRIARFYAKEDLPAFFSRTIVLNGDVPRNDKLSWIFTGPHAGFTVAISSQEVRVFQRYYDSYGLYGAGQPSQQVQVYPETVVRETVAPYQGHPRVVTVVLNSHLALQVWVNGKMLIEQQCLFDVQRHQMEFNALRTVHDVLAGALLPVGAPEASITVDPEHVHQTMMGFGGSPGIPAYKELSEDGKKKYWEILRSYNLLIDREYPMGRQLEPDMSNLDDLAYASPHYYGDNFPNGEVSDFKYNRQVLEMGGSVLYEMWRLPDWVDQPRTAGSSPATDRIADPEKYAAAMVNYCRIAKERTGRPPDIVGVQNEADQPDAVALEMVRLLRKRLNEAGFSSVKIQMADASLIYEGVDRARTLRAHPDVWKSIDIAATHEYDFQFVVTDIDVFDASMLEMKKASNGKPFLTTEVCINSPSLQTGSYRVAFSVAQLYHKNLTILDSVGLLYAWVILDAEQPNFRASRALLIPDRTDGEMPIASGSQLRLMGAFSRHIRNGMKRVDADTSDPDLLATAFRGDKGEATVIVLNRSNEPRKLAVKWRGVTWREAERTSQYFENAVSDPSEELLIQPGEILTLSTLVAGPAVH
jgi:O-glycosyl hydrolase